MSSTPPHQLDVAALEKVIHACLDIAIEAYNAYQASSASQTQQVLDLYNSNFNYGKENAEYIYECPHLWYWYYVLFQQNKLEVNPDVTDSSFIRHANTNGTKAFVKFLDSILQHPQTKTEQRWLREVGTMFTTYTILDDDDYGIIFRTNYTVTSKAIALVSYLIQWNMTTIIGGTPPDLNNVPEVYVYSDIVKTQLRDNDVSDNTLDIFKSILSERNIPINKLNIPLQGKYTKGGTNKHKTEPKPGPERYGKRIIYIGSRGGKYIKHKDQFIPLNKWVEKKNKKKSG